MEIRFADGTQIEVAASALDDFVRHDLKWAEYVHGTAAMKSPADPTVKFAPQRAKQIAKILCDARQHRVVDQGQTLSPQMNADNR
jgi:hypothetical protein